MKQDEYTKEEKMAILLGCGMMMHILEWILIIILLVSCSGPSKIRKVQVQQMTAEIGLVEQYEMVDQIDYMLAVIYSRQGKNKEAVERYLKACELTPSYWHRGNLDPEISELIKRYGLNQER